MEITALGGNETGAEKQTNNKVFQIYGNFASKMAQYMTINGAARAERCVDFEADEFN